ncbi:unnamed protein product [Phytomonas sp. Hart1]|nr:unnamed protein product [Phytomonas sp. Hart1]|eukprot:CCW68187.1 unnamed protein product [Phytomonas sp. isolate Hart1]
MYPNIRAFHSFLTDAKVEEKNIPLSKLSCLPDTNQVSLVFDGNKILDVITQAVRENDGVSVYTTTTSLALYEQISMFCELSTELLKNHLKQNDTDFKAIFTFNGCGFTPHPEVNPVAPTQPPTEVLHSSVFNQNLSAKNLSHDTVKRCAARFFIEEDVEARIVRMFHENCTNTFRAPYLAWSQISAFFAPNNQYASEVYGCLELLAFPGIERVVTNINIENQTFDCITKSTVLASVRKRCLDFSEEDLSSILLFESKNSLFYVNGMPDIFDDFCRYSSSEHGSRAMNFLNSSTRIKEEEKKLLRRNLAALDAPVLVKDSRCVFLSKLYNKKKQSDVTAAFGKRLPSVFYFFIFGGPVMTASYAALGQGTFVDNWPLIDTSTYRGIAENVFPLRVQIAFQLFLYTGYRSRLRWLRQYILFKFKEENDRRWSPIEEPPEIVLASWVVEPEILVTNEDNNVFLSDILAFQESAVSEKLVYPDIRTSLAVILLKSLDLLGYFTHTAEGVELSGPSIFSRALEKFNCPTLSEYGVLVIELVRTRTLHGDCIPLVIPHSNIPNEGPPRSVRFAARLLSVIPLNLMAPWSGPFDLEMAAFGTSSRLLGRMLRILTEAMAALLFATKSTNVPLSQFDEIIKRLPFGIPVEFNAGFLMTYVLMTECSLDDLRRTFPELYNLEEDLRTIFWFWKMASEALSLISAEEPALVDYFVLCEAHTLVSVACLRLCPGFWNEAFVTMQQESDFGMNGVNQVQYNMSSVSMPVNRTMKNGNY